MRTRTGLIGYALLVHACTLSAARIGGGRGGGGGGGGRGSGPLLPCGTTGDLAQDQTELVAVFDHVKDVCTQHGDICPPGAPLPTSCGSAECQQVVQLAGDSCATAFAQDHFLNQAWGASLNAVATVCATASLTVDVPGLGKMHGAVARVWKSVAAFKAIPYAEPPTQNLRWQPPVPHSAWQPAVLDATAFGNACPQRGNADGDGHDENCLFLNVYAPVSTLNNPSARLPVLFWIHGGAYKSGSSNTYFGDNIVGASHDSVVVVTINYRLNIFGFLGGRQISATTNGGGSGNFGIMDQRLAMQWVKQHIGAFGGDSDSVTIIGESAGGNSVLNHLAQPASFGLYQRAIVESGTYDKGAGNMSTSEASLSAVLANVGCSNLACLRAKDATTVESAARSMGFTGPIVDGISMMDTPAALIGLKLYNSQVPVLIGSNRDENAFFTLLQRLDPNMTEAEMESLFAERYPGLNQAKIAQIKATYAFPAAADAAEKADRYPYPTQLGAYSKWYWMFMRAATDTVPGLGACGVRWMDRLLVAGGTPNVYSYLFAHPPEERLGIPGGGGGIFAPHTSEISFVFATPVPVLTMEEAELARQVCQYWVAFAKNGNPNFSGAPTW